MLTDFRFSICRTQNPGLKINCQLLDICKLLNTSYTCENKSHQEEA